MKKLILSFFAMVLMFVVSSPVNAYVSVKGYYKKNGTYVAPYVRSNPNGLKSDNYSYTGGNAYNPSYGTRGTTWNTPTTVTDPNYYVGKNYYDTKTVPSTPMTFTPTPQTTPPVAEHFLPMYTPKPVVDDPYTIQAKKVVNQFTLDQWAKMIIDEYNKGSMTWTKATDTYAFIKKYHD